MSAELESGDTDRDDALTQPRVACLRQLTRTLDLPLTSKLSTLPLNCPAHFLEQAIFGTSDRLSAARVRRSGKERE